MLKKILSISGKPGLYRLISYGKGIIIVENVTDNKRMPAYTRDKIIALGRCIDHYCREIQLASARHQAVQKCCPASAILRRGSS